MFRAIDARMTDFVIRHLDVDPSEADRLRLHYWRRYGATLLGLVRHHGVDAHRFLHHSHDFDVGALVRSERGMGPALARLRGRKLLLTNAPARYADRVLRGVGLHRQIRERHSIERLRLHGSFRPKPSVSMFRAVLAREKLAGRANAGRAVLIDDSAPNLKAARAAGFVTVLRVGPATARPLAGAAYVDLRIRSVRQLARRLG